MARFNRNGNGGSGNGGHNGGNGGNGNGGSRQSEAKKPSFTADLPCRGGTISVAAWENTVGEGDQQRLVYMLTLNRSYNDGKDWKDTSSMRPEDVPILSVALHRAYEWTLDQGRE